MVIVVDRNGVRIEGAEDVKRFHIEAPDGVDVPAALVAAGFGRGADGGDDAYVSVAAVRAAVAGQVDVEAWTPAFDGMLGYARSKGWLDAAGDHIQAHIERRPG